MTKVVLETTMSTAQEMVRMMYDQLQQLDLKRTKNESPLEVWRHLVKSSDMSTKGKYTLARPVMVAACFPHIKPHPNFPIICVQLGPEDIGPTSTPDASRVAWYRCTLSLHIDPPVWELNEELGELEDPPVACQITVRVSNLVFQQFLDANTAMRNVRKTVNLSLYNDVMCTQQEMCKFIESFNYVAGLCHCGNSRRQIAESVWFDLVNARQGKNMFLLKVPYLFRMASGEYPVPEALQDYVCTLEQRDIDGQRYPTGLDPTAFIGLYAATYQLSLSTDKSRLSLVNSELWPNIPASFSELEQPPGCYVGLFMTIIEFVSTVREQEIMAMCQPSSRVRKTSTLFKLVNDFVEFFNKVG